jgi:hypothetical protein
VDEPRASRAQAKVVSASRTMLTALPSPLRGSIAPARRPSRSFVPRSRYGPHAAVAEEQRSRGAPPGPPSARRGQHRQGQGGRRKQGKQAQLAMMFRPGREPAASGPPLSLDPPKHQRTRWSLRRSAGHLRRDSASPRGAGPKGRERASDQRKGVISHVRFGGSRLSWEVVALIVPSLDLESAASKASRDAGAAGHRACGLVSVASQPVSSGRRRARSR